MADDLQLAADQPNPDGVIEVSNEFATVHIQRVETRNGARLRITSARLGSSIDLDALSLESLTWQPLETFSKFLAKPFGAEDH
jgi:hypothetical protein